MSKRAEEAALKAYPVKKLNRHVFLSLEYSAVLHAREWFQQGYEQAEKDTIERVCEWLEKNVTFIHPRKGVSTCIVNLSALREAILEEE